MRALVFLLVLANLLFFAWAQGYFGAAPSPDAGRMAQQVKPEMLHIVARGDAPPLVAGGDGPPLGTAAPAAAALSADTCLVWNNLISAEADRLARLVGERVPAAKLARKVESTTAKAWWVFIPPSPTRAELDRKVAELKRLEVGEYFVIQDAGPNRLAVSLGVFSTEAAANTHLESLRSTGVKGARVGPKSGIEQHVALELRGPAEDLAKLRDAVDNRQPAECNGANGAAAPAARP